jgi:hypothetical protein
MTARIDIRKVLAVALMLTAATLARAQADSTRQRVWQQERASLFAISHVDVLDTYLSQEKFKGTELRYLPQSRKQRQGSRVSRETMHQFMVSTAGTRGNSNSLLSAMYNLKFGWLYDWQLHNDGLTLRLGGLIDGTLGGTYNTRNSNNPAQARIALSVDPAARLTWRFRIRNHPLAVRYEASSPLAGLAFSPTTGSRTTRSSRRETTTTTSSLPRFFNALQLHHMLMLDFRLWRTTFSSGLFGRPATDESQRLEIPSVHARHCAGMATMTSLGTETHHHPWSTHRARILPNLLHPTFFDHSLCPDSHLSIRCSSSSSHPRASTRQNLPMTPTAISKPCGRLWTSTTVSSTRRVSTGTRCMHATAGRWMQG